MFAPTRTDHNHSDDCSLMEVKTKRRRPCVCRNNIPDDPKSNCLHVALCALPNAAFSMTDERDVRHHGDKQHQYLVRSNCAPRTFTRIFRDSVLLVNRRTWWPRR